MKHISPLVLPCANDDDCFMCYMCGKNDFPTVKNLYNHMACCHNSADWRDILPEELTDCSSIIVRHKLFEPISSDSDDSLNLMINDDECCSINESHAMVNLRNFLPDWSVTGKVSGKRGRSEVIKITDKVSPEVVCPQAKKLKVADAKNNDVLPEVVGLQVLKLKVAEVANAKNGKVLQESVDVSAKTTENKMDMAAGGGIIRMVSDFDLNEPVPEL